VAAPGARARVDVDAHRVLRRRVDEDLVGRSEAWLDRTGLAAAGTARLEGAVGGLRPITVTLQDQRDDDGGADRHPQTRPRRGRAGRGDGEAGDDHECAQDAEDDPGGCGEHGGYSIVGWLAAASASTTTAVP
jgi:hypothetical protein